MHPKVREFEQPLLKPDIPDFKPGDTVRISVRIQEGDKERVQDFEGVCIRRRGGGMRETFTLRRVSYGVGIERTFPLHSPFLESLKVVKRGKVRRAKLYYLRERRGKKARITEVRYEAPTEVVAGPADQETEVSEPQPPEAQPSDDKTPSNEQ